MQEFWKDVVGYENCFKVSNFGNVFSKRTGKLLKQRTTNSGYASIATKIGGRTGKAVCFKVHRLVAQAFLPNPEGKLTVNHKDSNRLNNHASNLEWMTQQENIKHGQDFGSIRYGLNRGKSKLTSEQVQEIRSNADCLSQRNLATEYSISKTMVHLIQQGQVLTSI